MASVAQLVRALDCDSRSRRFKSGHSPHFFVLFFMLISCSSTVITDNNDIEIFKKTGALQTEVVKETSKTKAVRKTFDMLYKDVKSEYGIMKFDNEKKLFISKCKNNRQIQAFLIGDDINIICYNTNKDCVFINRAPIRDCFKY